VNVHLINPISDSRWSAFAAEHPQASVFHQCGWLEALRRTYGYDPIAVTTTPPGEPLRNGIVLCRLSSWLTGNRLVSLPFADHCDPLFSDPRDFGHLVQWLTEECDRRRYRYVELRPLLSGVASEALQNDQSYCFHELNLGPGIHDLFRNLHKDSIQRRIRRAEKAHLLYSVGRTERLLRDFYDLLLLTRRRQQLPPQPRNWFGNLVECLGEKVQIRVLRKEDTPIAAILTLQHRNTITYKYGCSNEAFHKLGGTPLLFWKLIEESKAAGLRTVDFGRSDHQASGLITFKDRFGTTRRTLTYIRNSRTSRRKSTSRLRAHAIKQVFALLPDAFLTAAGKALYRHMG
jgi:CelD/BcsL family acetyltransferase involved in cellulose biosynthesis